MRRLFAFMLAACLVPALASAAPIASYQSGPFTLDSQDLDGGTLADPWLLGETFTAVGSGIVLFADTDGAPLPAVGITGHSTGAWITKTVINNTAEVWTSFEMELQEILGAPSGEGDGLSFAQGANLVFSSDKFTTYGRVDITRDYVNFSGGSVAIGESVVFMFAVTDNSANSFYLNQTPNKVDRVPEPTTMLLLGTAVVGLARRRRQ